ncbi:MAG: dihydrofolate reductase [Phaeodactylibacter sp.]|nr:dihydrofolate reductase [Phaeodactylibacter sp.]MCB9304017.1 dihydrofolate reductase [Lewinellaceae bacterium]
MKQVIIVAKSDNNVIGSGGELPWSLPADLAFFRQQIEGCYLLSGRRSYESEQGKEIFLGKDFVLITHQKGYRAKGGKIAHSIEAGIAMAQKDGAQRLCILGGAEIYRQTINTVDELVVTEVHATLEGDAFFPAIDSTIWQEAQREDHQKDADNPYDYSFVWYQRRDGVNG